MTKNPFFIYIFIFGFVFFAYHLGWSEIYPSINSEIVLFFLLSFFIATFLGIFSVRWLRVLPLHSVGILPNWVFYFLCAGFLADMVYEGAIPLWMIFSGRAYDYTDFGIPTLHVAIVTFGGVFSAIRFSDYIYSKNRWYLFQAFFPILYDVLSVNRGAVLLALVSWFFIFIIKNRRLKFKQIIFILILLFSMIFLFGWIGDMRSGDETIYEVGRPTEDFINSGLSKSYFWLYIYATSPIANLIETVNSYEVRNFEIFQQIVSEFIPNFISKRFFPVRSEIIQISPALNVGTVFSRSYIYAGWLGMFLMMGCLFSLIFIFIKLMWKSKYFVPALALINTLVVFCIFDNMIAFDGVILQIIWIILLSLSLKIKLLSIRSNY